MREAIKGFWLHVLLKPLNQMMLISRKQSPVDSFIVCVYIYIYIYFRVVFGYPEVDFEDFCGAWMSDNFYEIFTVIKMFLRDCGDSLSFIPLLWFVYICQSPFRVPSPVQVSPLLPFFRVQLFHEFKLSSLKIEAFSELRCGNCYHHASNVIEPRVNLLRRSSWIPPHMFGTNQTGSSRCRTCVKDLDNERNEQKHGSWGIGFRKNLT